MRGKTRRTSGGRLAAAAAVAAHLIYMAAAGPASAMQILEAADHGELAAEVSATGVNRIALSHDRIRRVIRAPGGFVTEHDPETGELWLRPVASEEPEAADRAPVILFIGTEKGFTYRLTLTPSDRDSAQILIRNGAALARAEAGAAVPATGADPRIGVRGRPRSLDPVESPSWFFPASGPAPALCDFSLTYPSPAISPIPSSAAIRSPVTAWSCARSSAASSVTSSARSRARLIST